MLMQLATRDVNVTEDEVEGDDGDDYDNDAWAKVCLVVLCLLTLHEISCGSMCVQQLLHV